MSRSKHVRGWKVTSDGTFWGGVLMLCTACGLLAVICVAATRR